MEFNYKEYSAALDEYLTKMQSIENEADTDTRYALERISNLLRIGRISLRYFESIKAERQEDGITVTFFESENIDPSNACHYRAVTEPGNVVIYSAYLRANSTPWSAEEKEKVNIILSVLYLFHGRIRTLRFIKSLTYFDQELKIPNLSYYIKHIESLIQKGKISDYAACFFNLKHFSLINQQVGREQGTRIMLAFIHKLSQNFTDDEIISRVSGDNFVVHFLKKNLDTILSQLKNTAISSDGPIPSKVTVSASCGVYLIPKECVGANEIMDCISSAVNLAKRQSKDSVVFYDEVFKQKANHTKSIQTLFPKAIREQDIEIVYQPKYNIKEGRMIGAEALCRWNHNGTQMMPDFFIPVLEQSDAICTLDFYILDHVCETIKEWLDKGLPMVRISVNLSRIHLCDPDLLQNILKIIDKHAVPHEYIELELTETATDISSQDLSRIVFGLKRAGIAISIDDFGVGYSSLKLLQTLPWDVLKLDKSFLEERDGSSPDKKHIILKHIIAMVRDLGAEFIVEGVETKEQAKLLMENDCYLVQGYLYDMPLDKPVFEARLMQLNQ